MRSYVLPALFLGLAVSVAVPAASAHVPRTVVVDVDESGFHPKTMTVLQGDTVEFRNVGTEEHWPASDFHPTHQVYPEFDPQRGLKPGERWSFRPEKAGDWKMHDHLAPRFLGVITVEKDPDFVPSNPDRADVELGVGAAFSAWWTRAYYGLFPSAGERSLAALKIPELLKDDKVLHYWFRVFGPDKFMQKLLADTNGGTIVDCHREAHVFGQLAYHYYGADAFAKGDLSCHSGFYHGAMETLLQEEGTDNLTTVLTDICSHFPTTFGGFECKHGVGHGVLAYENYDMPAAITLCNGLATAYDQSSCLGGMFMENIVTGLGIGAKPDHTTQWLSQDPLYPCNAVDQSEQVQHQCYLMQTSWMLKLKNYDFAAIALECQKAPEVMRPVCFKSYGRDAAGHTLRDPQKMLDLCSKVPAEGDAFEQCMSGGLHVIVDFWGDKLQGQASEFCKILPDTSKRSCYQQLAGRLTDIFATSAERQAVCGTFEESERGACAML